MPDPTDVNGEAVELVAKARYERLYPKSARWDELHVVVREQHLAQTRFDLETLASARRWEPCSTCGGTRHRFREPKTDVCAQCGRPIMLVSPHGEWFHIWSDVEQCDRSRSGDSTAPVGEPKP